jgi:hypothetical protein
MLGAGDVLQVLTAPAGGEPDGSDLTGTRIRASRPVELIGGHTCTYVPYNTSACDHLEDVIPPLSTLGREHIVAAPLIPTGGFTPKIELVRILATVDGTTLTYEPEIPGAPTEIATAGAYVELAALNDDFVITSDEPVIVTQYMIGQTGGEGNAGDPSMVTTIPSEQFRSSYEIHAEPEFDVNFITVVAPDGAEVLLDGVPLLPFQAIGGTGYAVTRTPLQLALDGYHRLTSEAPFGVYVYGYGIYATYWFAGGQRMDVLNGE